MIGERTSQKLLFGRHEAEPVASTSGQESITLEMRKAWGQTSTNTCHDSRHWNVSNGRFARLQSDLKMADALNLQMKVRQNAEELQDILKDLNSWEDEMKAKDKELRNSKIINKQVWCWKFLVFYSMSENF